MHRAAPGRQAETWPVAVLDRRSRTHAAALSEGAPHPCRAWLHYGEYVKHCGGRDASRSVPQRRVPVGQTPSTLVLSEAPLTAPEALLPSCCYPIKSRNRDLVVLSGNARDSTKSVKGQRSSRTEAQSRPRITGAA